jgi:SAM-dependent methyltransferase
MQKTWEQFWGDVFLWRLAELRPDIDRLREERAGWLWRTLGLQSGVRVLDLGCGNGMVGVHLARRGVHVTGVDRIESVLCRARQQAGDLPVTFVCADLRTVSYPQGSFDAIMLCEVVGLMSREDDAALIGRAARWLSPVGRLLVDCPCPPEAASHSVSWNLPEGRLTLDSTYDPETRLQHLVPTLDTADGETVELHDPYDPSRPDHTGVLRYIHPAEELAGTMEQAGLTVRRLSHPAGEGHFVLLGKA